MGAGWAAHGHDVVRIVPGPDHTERHYHANSRTDAAYDAVVCTTLFAEQEFSRIGAPNVRRVPLGVDLDSFAPTPRDEELRARYAGADQPLVVHCGRLSPEKRAIRSIEAVARLPLLSPSPHALRITSSPRRCCTTSATSTAPTPATTCCAAPTTAT